MHAVMNKTLFASFVYYFEYHIIAYANEETLRVNF